MTEWNYKILSLSLNEEGDPTLSYAAESVWANADPPYPSKLASVKLQLPDGQSAEGASEIKEENPSPEPDKRKDPGFELLRIIGMGGMGEVWQAVQVSLGRMVAIKRVRGDKETHGSKWDLIKDDFTCEAIVAGRLEHPNIVPVHDLCTDENGTPVLAMKLVEGREWSDLLEEDFPLLSPADLLGKHIPIMMGMVQAVVFAHSRGVVHRDLKPAQVMVGEYGEVLLSDWGLAVLTNQADTRFQNLRSLPTTDTASSPSGTPALMSPEQTQPTARGIGPWTDIYLIGATLYFLLTRTFPHQAQTARMSMTRAASGIIVAPSDREPDREIPRELEDLCLRCLAADPGNRPSSAALVLDELRAFLTGTGRRRESETLTRQVLDNFPNPHHTNYEALEAIWAALARAAELWPENPALPQLRERTLSLYSQTALEGRDLRLARLHAGRMAPGESKLEIVASIDAEEVRIAREHKGREMAKIGLAAAVLVIILGGGMFTVSLAETKERALEQRDQARQAMAQEDQARKQTLAALGETDELIEYMVGELGNELSTMGRLDILDAAMMEAQNALAQRDKWELKGEGSDHQISLMLQLSNIRRDQGRASESEVILRDALALAQEAVRENPTYKRRSLLALTWLHLGNIIFKLGRQEEAASTIREAMAQFEELTQENPSHLVNAGYLSDSWNRLGSVQSSMADLTGAQTSFENALRICEGLMEKDPENLHWKHSVCAAWGQLSSVHRSRGDLEAALSAQKIRIEYRTELAEQEPEDVSHQSDLAMAQSSLGSIFQAQGQLDEARKSFDLSLEIRAKIAADDPTNLEAKRDVATSYSRIGGLQQVRGELDDALVSFEQALEIHRELSKDVGNHERKRELGVMTGRVGDIKRAQGDLDGALQAYHESQQIMEELVNLDASNSDWERELGLAWQKVADIQEDQNDFAGAIESGEIALKLAEKLAALDPSNAGWQHDLRGAVRSLAKVYEKADQFEKAEAAHLRALEISERLVAVDSTDTSQKSELAVTLATMAGFMKDQGELEEALESYRASFSILGELADAAPSSADRRRNATMCQLEIGDVLARQERYDEALVALVSARDSFNQLVNISPNSATAREYLAEAHSRMGTVKRLQGNESEARAEWTTALEIVETALKKYPQHPALLADAAKLRKKLGIDDPVTQGPASPQGTQ